MDELTASLGVLQRHVENLIDCIRHNDITLQRCQALEMKLLTLNSLRELVEQAIDDAHTVFELDAVTFALVDEKGDLAAFLREDGLNPDRLPNLILLADEAVLKRAFGNGVQPYLGTCQPETCAPFLPAALGCPVASVALLPLYRRGRLLGSLTLASADASRFTAHMATDFLCRLSCVLSVCLENTLSFEVLRRTSLIDTLTGVNNRRFFDQRLGEEIDRAARAEECLSCLFLDIDHFKKINDTFGHQTGDQVLTEVARSIRATLRNNDVLARYGGEEFVALLAGTTDATAVEVAERIRRRIAQQEFVGKEGNPISVRISIGVATLDPARLEIAHAGAARLIESADSALYEAKRGGRNRVVSAGTVGLQETTTLSCMSRR